MNNLVPERAKKFRNSVGIFEDAVRTLEPVETELFHHFAHLTYTRELHIPAGAVATGKIHRHACTNILMKGRMRVVTEEDDFDVIAPAVWASGPGIKKVVYILEDVILLNVHPWDGKANLKEIEAEVIVPSYEQLQIEAGL
jgi:hypothetical protein